MPTDLFDNDNTIPDPIDLVELHEAPLKKKVLKLPAKPIDERVSEILVELRKYGNILRVTKLGLLEVVKVITVAESLLFEIEARLRTTRTTKRLDHLEAILRANSELTKKTQKIIPQSITTVSSFVVDKLPSAATDFNEILLPLVDPENKA